LCTGKTYRDFSIKIDCEVFFFGMIDDGLWSDSGIRGMGTRGDR
jgi:hypothetical protein